MWLLLGISWICSNQRVQKEGTGQHDGFGPYPLMLFPLVIPRCAMTTCTCIYCSLAVQAEPASNWLGPVQQAKFPAISAYFNHLQNSHHQGLTKEVWICRTWQSFWVTPLSISNAMWDQFFVVAMLHDVWVHHPPGFSLPRHASAMRPVRPSCNPRLRHWSPGEEPRFWVGGWMKTGWKSAVGTNFYPRIIQEKWMSMT